MKKVMILTLILLLFIYGCSSGTVQTGESGSGDDGDSQPEAKSGGISGLFGGGSKEIEIVGNQFVEGTRTVKVGTTINWVNRDSIDHTVSFEDETILDLVADPGETLSATFNEVGTFKYKCKLHPEMTGIITVE